MDIDFETGAPVNLTAHQPSEFFQALYWKFEGRMIRLTTFDERNLSDAEQTEIAYRRARAWELSPYYMRIFSGSFLRYGADNMVACYDEDGGLCVECDNV